MNVVAFAPVSQIAELSADEIAMVEGAGLDEITQELVDAVYDAGHKVGAAARRLYNNL